MLGAGWYNMEYWMIGWTLSTGQRRGKKINRERERERETTLTEMTVPSGSSSLFPFTWEDDTILERDRLGMSLNISICLWVLTNILSLSLSLTGLVTSVTQSDISTLTDSQSYTYLPSHHLTISPSDHHSIWADKWYCRKIVAAPEIYLEYGDILGQS